MDNSITKSITGSKRINVGKPEYTQLDPNFITGLAKLMTVSAEKYGKYNWALGQNYTTASDSLMRHLNSFLLGEDYDKESGMSHLLHIAANTMILFTSWSMNNEALDDRFFKKQD